MNRRIWTALAAVSVCAAMAVALSLAAGMWNPIGVAAAPAEVDAAVLYVAPGGNCGGASPCYATVQGALDAASGGDTVKVAQGIYTSTGAEVARVEESVTLAGGYSITNWSTPHPDTQPSVLDAEGADRRGIYVDGTGLPAITLSGLTVQRGAPKATGGDAPGAGIYVQGGDVTIRHSLVMSNTNINGGTGAGLHIEGGSVTLQGNTFRDNNAAGGGGVNVEHGTMTSTGDRFLDNSAFWSGGLRIWDGDVTISDATFRANSAGNKGGGVAVIGPSTVTLRSCLLQENWTENTNSGGGGLHVDHADAVVTLSGNTVLSNTTWLDASPGGGLLVDQGTVVMSWNTFRGNSATSGGGVRVEQGTVTSTCDRFVDNSAFWSGGLEVRGGDVAVSNAIFEANSAGNTGGAIAVIGSSKLVLQDSLIQDNESQNDGQGGGGIFVNDPLADVTLSGNTIAGNTTSYNGGSGGGLKVQNGIVVAYENTFQGNSAAGGGAVEGGGGSLTLRRNRFVSNSAFFGGTLQLAGANVTMNANTILGSNAGPAQGTAVSVTGGTVDARNDVIADILNPDGEAVYVGAGTLVARHWTLANNGSYAVLLAGGTATLTNAIIAGHTVAGLSGAGITAGTTLFHNNGTNCADGAICSNSLSGDPAFVDPAAGDYHITIGSAAMDAGVDALVNDDLDGHYRPYNLGPDIGADELVATVADPGSSTTLVYTDTWGSPTAINMPAGAVEDPITLLYTPVATATAPTGLGFAGHAFDLEGYSGETLLPGLALDAPATVTIAYTQTEVSGLDKTALVLYYWDGAGRAWQDAACGPYERNADENWVSVPICHLSRFALFAEELHAVYLPVLLRNQ